MIAMLLACNMTPSPPLALPPQPLPATGPVPTAAATAPPSRELGSLRIVATGDLLLHKTVQDAADHAGYEALFAATKPLIEAGDVAFVNLETPIAPKTGKPIVPLVFNASPQALQALVATGFDLVSFANNHVYDQGRPGFEETLDQLDKAGLPYVGAGRTCAEAARPHVIERNGVKVAFLGTSRWYNDRLNAGADEPCADTFSTDKVIAAAKAARADGADAVVLSIHWGREYATKPSPDQVEDATSMIEGGVDLLLGHHTHVLGPVQVVHAADGRVGVIAYSLGNYISNQSAWYEPGLNPPSAGHPRDGVVLSIRVVKREYGNADQQVVRVELADLAAQPLWTVNDKLVRGDNPPVVRVEPLIDRLGRLREAMAAARDRSEIVRIGTEIDEMERRWKAVKRVVGEQFLADRP